MKTTRYFVRGGRLLPLALFAAATGITTAHAELLILNQGGSRGPGYVQSVNVTSGLTSAWFGPDNEGLTHLTVTRGQNVLVTARVLGDDNAFAFNRDERYVGVLSSWVRDGQLGNVEIGGDGRLYATAIVDARRRLVVLTPDGAEPVDGAALELLPSPGTITFGPDGLLYVADAERGIVRVDVAARRVVDVFVPAALAGTANALSFGPDGRLYLASRNENAVRRAPLTGGYTELFIAPGLAGLTAPSGLAFGPDGSLYVASRGTRQVIRFDGRTGVFHRVVASLPAPAVLGELAYLADPEPAPIAASPVEEQHDGPVAN